VRQLYTDAEEVLFEASRPILLNGIEEALPREERELMIAANNSYLLAFDNLSGLPHAASR
jgi:hypothetical protein